MVEPGVARAATQDMDPLDHDAGQPADPLKHLAIAQHQAFHDAACKCRRLLKRRLPVFQQRRIDRGRHILWGQEARIVRVDQGGEWPDSVHLGQQRVIVADMPVARPTPLAFLQEPQPHHIFEKARRPEDAALVGTVGRQRLPRHDRLL